jgi:hypothetical protein
MVDQTATGTQPNRSESSRALLLDGYLVKQDIANNHWSISGSEGCGIVYGVVLLAQRAS